MKLYHMNEEYNLDTSAGHPNKRLNKNLLFMLCGIFIFILEIAIIIFYLSIG